MRLVDPDQRLHGAGMCFLCETAIEHPGRPVVNTNMEFDPPFQTPLAGEKYVCGGCSDTIAKTLGYIDPEQAATLAEAAVFAELRFRQLQELAASLNGSLPAIVPVTTTKEKVSGK